MPLACVSALSADLHPELVVVIQEDLRAEHPGVDQIELESGRRPQDSAIESAGHVDSIT